jgi:prepilin-type N-terminal cleavage/methylation domain-containing protein
VSWIPNNRKSSGRARRSAVRSQVGFTLIEILITVLLIAILLLLVGYPIIAGFAYMEKSVARADAQSAARLALDAMTRELAEAMYVFDVPVGGGFVAFLPAQSSGRGRAAPIAPAPDAIRYWRALRDPSLAYAPFWRGGSQWNPYYLARTQIPEPARRDDAWNDSGGALPRATFWYADRHAYPPGRVWPTAQPGYPWLPAPGDAQLYRQVAVALTPSNPDYDIPIIGFSPARIASETLIPWTGAFPRDYSRYRARYPLWEGFAQWDPAAAPPAFQSMGQVRVYMVLAGNPERRLAYRTRVDPASGAVTVGRVVDADDPTQDVALYDIADYPNRNVTDAGQAEFAFGVDYDRGEVRFDFPAEERLAAAASIYRYNLSDATLSPPPRLSYLPDLDPDPLRDSRCIVRGSTSVWIERGADITYCKLVEPMPARADRIGAGNYAIDGLYIVFDQDPGDHPRDGDIIHIQYRYRNNPEDQLVVATYDTKAIINISLTVSKRDVAARTPKAARQDVTLAAKVRLKNVPR